MFIEKKECLKLIHRRHRIVGAHSDAGFVVLEGSDLAWPDTYNPCMAPANIAIRKQLFKEGVAVLAWGGPSEVSYRLTRDYAFTSPGQAASVLLGTHGRRPRHWTPCVDPGTYIFGPGGANTVLRLWPAADGGTIPGPWDANKEKDGRR